MNRIKHVLVSTDHVNDRTPGMHAGAIIASEVGAELIVQHVIPGVEQYDFLMENLAQSLLKEAEQEIKNSCASLKVSPEPSLKVLVSTGSPLDRILESMEDVTADLVVLDAEAYGEHGSGTVSNVVRSLIHTLPHDVLMVREGFEGPYKNILVATDFSEGASAAMDRAVSLAKLNGVDKLTVVNAFEVPPRQYLAGVTDEEAHDRILGFAKKHFDEWIGKIDTKGVNVEPHFVEGNPVKAIQDTATEKGCDLVIIGSIGHTASSVLLLGAVAEKVIHKLKCSVWVERLEGHSMTFGHMLAKLMGIG